MSVATPLAPVAAAAPTVRAVRRVLALTQGIAVPSARFRVRQLVPHLAEHGVTLDERPARFGAYPPRSRAARPLWLAATLAERLSAVVESRGADVVLLQRELVSTLASLEPLAGHPRVLDVDDAIWLHRGGAAARALARGCDAVVCGNAFLAEWFSRHNARVSVVPTGVDTTRFAPRARARADDPAPVLGWSGTAAGFPHLYAIEGALARVLARHPRATLRVLADRAPAFAALPAERVTFVRWSPEAELAALQSMTVGLMPLPDDDWARGKCSYKMLLYMACGLPVVVSPVGMNAEVLALGDVGHGARDDAEWVDALDALLADPAAAARLGAAGRRVVERHFALPDVAAALAAQLHAA